MLPALPLLKMLPGVDLAMKAGEAVLGGGEKKKENTDIQ
ncbi:hypothetical protein HDC89_001529 [Herbaspirillum sp. SJZ102]|nr:hypothetical protein [Herbaspirillum sp. SJZ102]